MRTIGRRRPANSPKGDFEAQCAYCGVAHYRSELRRDGTGNLMCPADDGIDAKTLDEMNAAMNTPPETFPNDSKADAKSTDVAPSIRARIGNVTFGSSI